jgi:hypothetical protein
MFNLYELVNCDRKQHNFTIVTWRLMGERFLICYHMITHVSLIPVTTAWRVLRLQMEEKPPAIEGTCEYIE